MSKTIRSVFYDSETGYGIFHYLQNLNVPWKSENISDSLDEVYISKSGCKTIAPLIESELVGGELSEQSKQKIATAIHRIFSVQWSKRYATLNFEYNPIENYRMTETEETVIHDETNRTENGTVNRDDSTTRTDSGTIGTVDTRSENSDVFGFNSNDAVGSDSLGVSGSSTDTHNLTYTETLDGEEVRADSSASESDRTDSRELTRGGNIGVTTSQQMVTSERDLWNWNYFSTIFKDIDSLTTLEIYDCEVY